MYQVRDTVGTFKVAQAHATGNADNDLNDLTAQHGGGIAVFLDLDASIKPILDELPKYALTALASKNKCLWPKDVPKAQQWDLFYTPGKVFSVSYGYNDNCMFYNLAQYFDLNNLDPDLVATFKDDELGMAEALANHLESALHQMGIWAHKLSSPASIFVDYYGKHMDLPNWHDHFLPFGNKYDRLFEYAAQCAGNEWSEVFKIGHFSKCFSYDRKSAYANQMIRLLDNRPRYMDIVESDEYIKEAEYAYCKCNIEIYEKVKLHPIIYIDPHTKSLSCRTGEMDGVFLTKGQMDSMRRWQNGEYEVRNGFWLIPKTRVRPLEHIIPRILAYKEHPNTLVQDLAKNMINGFAGKLNEKYKDRVGDLYNPMWSAEIITGNALALCDTIYRNHCHPDVIQIKVDEFKLTRQLAAVPEGYKETSGECLAIDNQNVYYRQQHPNNLTYAQAMELLAAHPNTSYFPEGIDLIKRNLSRDFEALPDTSAELLNEVYESKPLTVGD